MHCRACDTMLNDFETTRKDTRGEYLDLCSCCFDEIKYDVLVVEREDLRQEVSIDEYLPGLEEN